MPSLQSTLPALLLAGSMASSQTLDQAQVQIPYAEFKQLLQQASTASPKSAPAPRLLTARLKLGYERQEPILSASFKVASFHEGLATTALIGGSLTLDNQQPESSLVVFEEDHLCLVSRAAGTQSIQLRLLPRLIQQRLCLEIPACPSAILEIGQLPAGQSLILESELGDQMLASGTTVALPAEGGRVVLRVLDESQTRQALLPPEPSTWNWQHHALVEPDGDELIYQIVTHARAGGGSGVEAILPLPAEARRIEVEGEDLSASTPSHDEKRNPILKLCWQTRDILDRQMILRYRMPLRPLDDHWTLQVPGGDTCRTRFILPDNPLLSIQAEGLSPLCQADGLPPALIKTLQGRALRTLETGDKARIAITRVPVALTADGVIRRADWSLNLEADGSMLVTGTMQIEHQTPLNVDLICPVALKLLQCTVNGQKIAPIDAGNGKLLFSLPGSKELSNITLSLTGEAGALDPVEGALKLELPRTSLFIHTLDWKLALPMGYQAETHGNLARLPASGNPGALLLRKNFCRDHAPEIHLFYNRINLPR